MTTRDADPILDAMWNAALEAWEDDKRHAALLDYALRNQKLPTLAGNYRALKDDPEKGALSKKRLDAIVLAATQMLMTMKTPKPTKNPPWLIASAAMIMLVVIGYVVYALFKR